VRRLTACHFRCLACDCIFTHLFSRGTNPLSPIRRLLPILDEIVTDCDDHESYEWWRSQRIAGGGVPDSVVPTSSWPIPRFKLCGRIALPGGSLHVGPTFLAGDCKQAGVGMKFPWLFLIALFSLGASALDIFLKAYAYSKGTEFYSIFDWIWLGIMAALNLSPFLAGLKLFDTRYDCSVPLKPLLASKAILNGVHIRVIGSRAIEVGGDGGADANADVDETVAQAIGQFLTLIGHNRDDGEDTSKVRENSPRSCARFDSLLICMFALCTFVLHLCPAP
jgi:hypothetical protein